MRRKSILAIFFVALILSGCARSLEKGWKKEDKGETAVAIKNFSQALTDSNDTYRRLAAEELIKIGEPAVPALEKALLRKSSYYDIYYNDSRKEAAWALGEIGSAKAVPSLLTALKTAREVYQEKDLIAKINNLKSRARLAKMVKEVMNLSVKKGDQQTIAKTMKKYVKKIEEALRAAFKDKDGFYREQELVSAINRIKLLQLPGEAGKKVKKEALKIVQNRLRAKRSSPPSYLISSIEALGKIGDNRADGPLLYTFEEASLRPEVALALAKIGDRKVLPFLEKAWEKEDKDSLKMSLEAALYLMGDESKGELLIKKLGDKKLQMEAVKLLGEIGDKKGVEPLIETLSDESPELRLETVKALHRIGGKEAEEALLGALNDNNPQVKKEAILAVVNSEKSVDALRKITADEKELLIVRLAAASRLGEWNKENNFPLAMKVAKEKTFSKEERIMAINVLASTEASRDILREIYEDTSENFLIRFQARKALRQGDKR